ncbi:MAG: response regulator [Rhodospirillaceae bacterium]|jgi:signal transduction histidine kinase/DNA-binding response OmpR family regulator|nr:response regulator [Rhodospirillaceae bacterium]MBT3929163.1 response regulator [Rhodospirillaceae bacterium]MBT5358773.1 response regulator [Rhodospirillaceae bacterium]MBT5768498.1 response regulator [Rhodospirillaceae bacterium]MBT6308327.1 response regulator [Rhodospirillaceae bacterium]
MVDSETQAPDSTKEGWQAQATRYALLFDIVLLIARSENFEDLLSQAVGRVKWVFDFERCTLALRNPDEETYDFRTLLDTRRGSELFSVGDVPLSQGLSGEVMSSGQMKLFTDKSAAADGIASALDPALANGEMGSVLALPLEAYGQVLGCMTFGATRENCFSDEDVKIAVQFATHLGLAIDRWRQTDALQGEVSERRRAESELAALIEELQTANVDVEAARTQLYDAIEAISEGFALFDTEDRFVLSNSVYKEYFRGVTDKIEPGAPWAEFFRTGLKRGVIERTADTIEAEIEETKVIRHGGRSLERQLGEGRWLRVGHRPTETGGLVTVYTDITELKERERQLGELVDSLAGARDEAMEATRTKSQFLANMSHELRTPLNAVIGIAEMLQEEAVDDGLKDFVEPLERINKAGIHLLNLINEILDLSKIEAGRVEFETGNIEVDALVGEVATMVQSLADQNSNTLMVDCADDAGAIHGDPTRVRQVVFNLLSNACKFTENGKVNLRVRRQAGDAGEMINFEVSDTGIGISEQQVERLFQEFSQADASTTRKYGGTGLGLAISQRLCRLMGGDVTVESELGKGTTFTACIPVHVAGTSSADLDDVHRDHSATTDQAPRGNLVLVIDDDPTVRDLMRRHLEHDGAEVITADGGVEGLRLARERLPSVITLDVLMPDMDGWRVLRELKADKDLALIPVVMVTMLDDKNKGYALGVSDYLNKPVSREQLRSMVERFLVNSAGAHVLVVEDDETARTMMRRILVSEGCLVSEAVNGRRALERVSDERPDLILLDLMMPEMNGFEFLQELRANPETIDIPVIVVTAADLTEADRLRLNGGVEQVLQKSEFDREKLLDEVRRQVARVTDRVPPEGDG